MTSPPLGCAFAPPKSFWGCEKVYPLPPLTAAATPAGLVSGAAAWLRVLPGLRPPPPALVVPPLVRGGCGCCCGCFGFARRRRPVLRRGSRGRGVSSLGSLTLACAAVLGAGYAPPAWVCLRSFLAPLPGLGRKPPCALRGLCALPLGSVAVAPLRPAWSWAQAALRLCLRCRPARCRVQPLRGNAAPAAKLHRNASKLNRKASKSALFVRHIAASVPVCVNGQYAEKPRFRGFSGSH